jgi:hypothetical protein
LEQKLKEVKAKPAASGKCYKKFRAVNYDSSKISCEVHCMQTTMQRAGLHGNLFCNGRNLQVSNVYKNAALNLKLFTDITDSLAQYARVFCH